MLARVAPLLLALLTWIGAGCGAAPLPTPRAAGAHQTYSLRSDALGEVRRINVYLPPGYDSSADRFPVLYMPDGGMDEDFPHVAAAVDRGIREGAVRPLLVVGIENTERRRDLTGPTTVATDRAIAPRVGGSAAFRRFLAEELFADVGRRYRVNERRAILGESLAGLFIVETFLVQPDLFDTYLALSPSLWWNAQALGKGLPAWLAAHPQVESGTTLYLASASDDDRDDAVASFVATLTRSVPAGLTFRFEKRPDATHATIYARSEDAVLRRFLGAQPGRRLSATR